MKVNDLMSDINRWLSGEILDIGIIGKQAEGNADLEYVLRSLQERAGSMRTILGRIENEGIH